MTENVNNKHIKYKELSIYMFKMDLVDILVSKVNKIKNKFLVVVIDDDNDSEDNSEVTRLKEDIITRIEYRLPELDEFDFSDLILIGNFMLFSALFLKNFLFLIKLSYLSFVIMNGFGFGAMVVAYSHNFIKHLEQSKLEQYELEEQQFNETLETQYNDFLNVYYDDFSSLYQENSEEYKTMCLEDESSLKSLKEKENHFSLNLPIESNNKIIMFYDHDNDVFNYYTKSSDVIYKVLNACCRCYVYEKKCMNLFKDDEEISYIKTLSQKDDVKETHEEPYEELENIPTGEEDETKQEDVKENEDKKGGIFSMFHNKAEAKEKIKKNDLSVNKFIRLGNIEDYNKKYKVKQEAKKIDYNDFKKLFDKNNG